MTHVVQNPDGALNIIQSKDLNFAINESQEVPNFSDVTIDVRFLEEEAETPSTEMMNFVFEDIQHNQKIGMSMNVIQLCFMIGLYYTNETLVMFPYDGILYFLSLNGVYYLNRTMLIVYNSFETLNIVLYVISLNYMYSNVYLFIFVILKIINIRINSIILSNIEVLRTLAPFQGSFN